MCKTNGIMQWEGEKRKERKIEGKTCRDKVKTKVERQGERWKEGEREREREQELERESEKERQSEQDGRSKDSYLPK